MRFRYFFESVDWFDLASKIYKSDKSRIKSPEAILKYVDSHTDGHINYRLWREQLSSEWYILGWVPVVLLLIQDEDLISSDSANPSLSPIVIDSDMNVLDGRHRVIHHKKLGFDQISSWMPIEVFAKLNKEYL